MASKSFKPFYSLHSVLPFTIMDRYLAMQLLPPFLFGVGAFTSVVLAIDSLFELLRKVVESGLPLTVALQVFLLKLPYVIVYAFPMSTLLAALMTYSRLSSDSELVALRGCGVSVYRMVLTAVMLSALVTGMTFVFNEHIAPAANYQAAITLEKALKSEKPSVKRDNFIYPETREVKQPDGKKKRILMRLYYADQFDGKRFNGLTIIDRSREGANQIIVAEAAEWNVSQNTWNVFNGTLYLVAPDRSYRNIAQFKNYQMQLPRTAFNLAETNPRIRRNEYCPSDGTARNRTIGRRSAKNSQTRSSDSTKNRLSICMCNFWLSRFSNGNYTPAHWTGNKFWY